MFRSSLFSKEIPPACQYCRYGFLNYNGDGVLCEKKGPVPLFGSCRKFRYAPLKRVPKRPRALPEFDPGEFEL